MIKSFVSLALVAVCAMTVSAQNARTAAMGNVFNVEDATHMLRNPAFMNDYKDFAQITVGDAAGRDSINPIMGVKAIGEKISVGTYYIPLRILSDAANNLLATYETQTSKPGTTNVDPIPHLLLGMDLGSMQIGADLFFERGWYKLHGKSPTTEVTTKWKFSQPGINLGAKFSTIPVSFNIGASLPIASYSDKNVTTGLPTTEETQKASGFQGKVGAELGLKGMSTALTVGIDGDLLSWKWKQNPVGLPAVTSNKYSSTGARVYLGLDKKSAELGAEFAGLVVLGVTHDKDNNKDSLITTSNKISVSLNAGTEKVWTPEYIKFFDLAAVRAGVDYKITRVIAHGTDKATAGTSEGDIRDGAKRTVVRPYIGAGLGKKSVSFDVAIDALAMANVFKLVNGTMTPANNDFAKATLTVDFGKADRVAN